MEMRGICSVSLCSTQRNKEQKMWIYAEVPLPNR